MRFGFLLLAAAASMMLGLTVRAHEYSVGSLFVHHPAVNATPPGADTAVGYFEVKNNGDKDDELTGIDAPGLAKTADLHSMTMDGGKMEMRKLPVLTIPAHQSVALSPTGNHVMFSGLKAAVKKGDKFDATLHFKNAGDVKVYFAGEEIGHTPDAAGHDDMKDMPGMEHGK